MSLAELRTVYTSDLYDDDCFLDYLPYKVYSHDSVEFLPSRDFNSSSMVIINPHTKQPDLVWQQLDQPICNVVKTNPQHKPGQGSLRIVCLSDTKGCHEIIASQIPWGHVLVHCGNFTISGQPHEVKEFNEFLGTLPHKFNIVIAGTNEITFDRNTYSNSETIWKKYKHYKKFDSNQIKNLLTNAIYLEDYGCRIKGIEFYGTPWHANDIHDDSFGVPRGKSILNKWNMIPSNTRVLLTHAPPVGLLDIKSKVKIGDAELLSTVQERVKPDVHIFGHACDSFGSYSDDITNYYNASIVNSNGEIDGYAQVIDI